MLRNLKSESTVLSKLEVNINQENSTSLIGNQTFRVPNSVPKLSTSSIINEFELNIDQKNFSINNALAEINPNGSLTNITSTINNQDLNIDSRLGNLTTNQSVFNGKNSSFNLLECNIDSKNGLISLKDTANDDQSKFNVIDSNIRASKRLKKSNSGERLFECDHYEKKFTQSGNFPIHKNEKPFKCDQCEYK